MVSVLGGMVGWNGGSLRPRIATVRLGGSILHTHNTCSCQLGMPLFDTILQLCMACSSRAQSRDFLVRAVRHPGLHTDKHNARRVSER